MRLQPSKFFLALALLLPTTALCQPSSFRWPGGAKGAVSLTYDDGVDVHLDHVAPDLEAAGLRGTFYIPGRSTSLRKRMEEWRALARRGHELGNHTSVHPCLREEPGRIRTFVVPERMLELYTVPRMVDDVLVMNSLLYAVDGLSSRSFAYPCGDEVAGGVSYVDKLRPLFPGARSYTSTETADPRTVDLHRVPSWGVAGVTAGEMISWIEKAVSAGKLAVIAFHGVGGGHGINVDREEHRKLLAHLAANRERIWTAPFLKLVEHISAERKASTAAAGEDLRWIDAREHGVEGKGWTKTAAFFDRLPAAAEGVVRPPVWSLSRNSAGMAIHFTTDSSVIAARWTLTRPQSLALPHMPATGVSGLDLYVKHGARWRWLANGRPETAPVQEKVLVRNLSKSRREYLLYLPLYNGTQSLEIGVARDAAFDEATSSKKPIVVYGTSITQGGCASRPGMAYPAILGRMLEWPTINLGFSGNGKAEPEMAKLLAGLDPAAYVLDPLPNLSPEETAERMEPLIGALRQAHPSTPILLVENVIYTDAFLNEARARRCNGSNQALAATYKKLRAAGDRHLLYIPGAPLLGDDGEGTVDGTHATDLGFLRMAETIAPVLRKALGLR